MKTEIEKYLNEMEKTIMDNPLSRKSLTALELMKSISQIREALGSVNELNKSDVSGQLPHDLRRKIEIHIETTLKCIENFGIPKYVKELLGQDIELYREILQKTK